MRILEFSQCLSQMEEIRHSTHKTKQMHSGQTHQLINSGHGKTRNKDYEPLHYENT